MGLQQLKNLTLSVQILTFKVGPRTEKGFKVLITSVAFSHLYCVSLKKKLKEKGVLNLLQCLPQILHHIMQVIFSHLKLCVAVETEIHMFKNYDFITRRLKG